ncbi:MAG: NUDIX domain-containing protein [Candidatus Symbiothrix sp.]|jgi:hypothetical protein|nr:NUDIX domain-containing protein [Candidatus Symbiothrix sp.]
MSEGSIQNVLETDADALLPGISVDCVIFGFHNGTLMVLLNKFSSFHKWTLPGGFVLKEENVEEAAHRILEKRTGLKNLYLHQFYTFGDVSRTGSDIEFPTGHWLIQRFVSIGYYAFVEYSKVRIYTSSEEDLEWFAINKVPQLYADHNSIIEKAIAGIRKQINIVPIGYNLLPEKFTLTELRLIYEAILGKELDRRNFQRKILSTGLINRLDEVQKKIGLKPTTMFAFNKEKYREALKNGTPLF